MVGVFFKVQQVLLLFLQEYFFNYWPFIFLYKFQNQLVRLHQNYSLLTYDGMDLNLQISLQKINIFKSLFSNQ